MEFPAAQVSERRQQGELGDEQARGVPECGQLRGLGLVETDVGSYSGID